MRRDAGRIDGFLHEVLRDRHKRCKARCPTGTSYEARYIKLQISSSTCMNLCSSFHEFLVAFRMHACIPPDKLTCSLVAGEAKLVLTWGKTPKDCDLYLLAPHQDPRKPPCEVSWKNKNCFSSKVTLDRDDTESHGPETISLSGFMNPGKYVVRVDEYMGNPLAQQLVGGHATVAYYSPHMGGMLNYAGSQGYIDGKVWYVLAIDGTTRQPVACTPEICPKRPLGLLGNN